MNDRYEFFLRSQPPREELEARKTRIDAFADARKALEEENSYLDQRRVEYRMNQRAIEMLQDKLRYDKERAAELASMIGEHLGDDGPAPENVTSVSTNRTRFKLVNPRFRVKSNGFAHLVDADVYPAEITRIVLAPEGNRAKIWGSPALGGSLFEVGSEDLDIVEEIQVVDDMSGEYVVFLTTEDWVDLASLTE